MSNRIIKDTIAITVITLVAGLALGVVQDITADPIAKQEAQAKQDAYKAVFADADSFETVDVDADAMQSYLDENGYAAQSIDETMLAKDASGNELGYAFTVTTSEGYGGDIQFAMGIQDDGTLNGISILSIGETAGLGMRANTDAFKDQFKDKKVDKFEYTKTGENFGYLLVDGRTIPVYTIVNDKTLSEIELNKFLEYNVNKVIEYYNDFKEEKHGIKKDSKRYLAK